MYILEQKHTQANCSLVSTSKAQCNKLV